MTSPQSVTVRMTNVIQWLFPLVGAVLGACVGLVAEPIFGWLDSTIGDAPGPLRVVAHLPTAWAVAALIVVGLGGGVVLALIAKRESLVLTVNTEAVRLTQDRDDRYVPRGSIAAVFRDGEELVLIDSGSQELARVDASDLSATKIQDAFERCHYPWTEGHPYEQEFHRWVDGHPALDDHSNHLLRARARALTDKRTGMAADLTEQLQDAGVVVRDRHGAQQYRLVR